MSLKGDPFLNTSFSVFFVEKKYIYNGLDSSMYDIPPITPLFSPSLLLVEFLDLRYLF